MLNALLALLLVVAAFLIAFAVLLLFARVNNRRAGGLRQLSEAERAAIVFVFENETLVDATPAAVEASRC